MRTSDWSSDVCSSDLAIAADIVINGLAILCRDCSGRPVYYDLEEAYRRDIIGGPAAFVITADDMASFATAVRKKLLLEIADVPDEATFRQRLAVRGVRSEEHTSELQSLMRISYAVFCLKNKKSRQ